MFLPFTHRSQSFPLQGFHETAYSNFSNVPFPLMHYILQTLGLRPLRVFRLVLIESVLLSTLGGILGVAGSAWLLSSSGMSVAAEGVTIAFQPSFALAIRGVLLAVAVGILAGLAPGWHASRADIVTALRHA